MTHQAVDQNSCPHDAKVMMAGLKDMYECTNCHKFVPVTESKNTDLTAPQYLEGGWDDDWD